MPQLSPLDQLIVSEVFEHHLGKQMTVLKQVCDRGAAERDVAGKRQQSQG